MPYLLSPFLILIAQLILQKTKDRHVLIGIDLYPAPWCYFADIAGHPMHPHQIILPLIPLIFHVDPPRCVLFSISPSLQMLLVHPNASIVLHDQGSNMPQVSEHLPSGLVLIVILPLDQVMNPSSDALLAYDPLNWVQISHTHLQILNKSLSLLAYNPFYQDNIVKMTYRQQPYIRPNDTYASIREQMDRETQGITADRNSIQVYRPSNTYVPTNRNIDTTPQSKWQPQFSQKRSSYQVENSKKNEIKNRIKEIIDLCKDENSAVHREMTGVIEAEKGVLNLLGQAQVQGFRQVAPGGTQFTPVKTDDYRPNTQQREIRSVITQNGHIQLPEEAQQLINEIERRSLAEIEKLRAELNYERKKNVQLEKEVNYYRNSQGAPGSGYENELRSKVAYLEDLLQQQEQHKGTGGIDFNALYAQGEAIRQETLRLLRLKQAKLNGGYEDEQKRRLREQVDRLNRKIQQLQHQRGRASKPSYEVIAEQYSPIAPAYKRSNSNRNSANQYQSLVMQMRKITAN